MFEEMTAVPLSSVHHYEVRDAFVQSHHILDSGPSGYKLVNDTRMPLLHKAKLSDLIAARMQAKRRGDALYLEPEEQHELLW